MKKINLKSKSKNHFIGAWKIDNNQINENLINFFNQDHENHVHSLDDSNNSDSKKSDFIRLNISPKRVKEEKLSIFNEYLEYLLECYQDYQKEWDFLENWNRVFIGNFFIDKFLISGHHEEYHCDRENIDSSHKILSWATFLNDIDDDEGNIEFKYLNTVIKPKKGTTLIWPSDWTHLYKENTIKKNEKFVIRGCIHFPDTILGSET